MGASPCLHHLLTVLLSKDGVAKKDEGVLHNVDP